METRCHARHTAALPQLTLGPHFSPDLTLGPHFSPKLTLGPHFSSGLTLGPNLSRANLQSLFLLIS